MDKLKELAAPRNAEILKATLEQNDLLDIQIVLLDRLCTLKEAQQESDDNFRATWWKSKVLDTRVSIIVLFIAVAGVSFDVIEVNSNSAIIGWLSGLFGV